MNNWPAWLYWCTFFGSEIQKYLGRWNVNDVKLLKIHKKIYNMEKRKNIYEKNISAILSDFIFMWHIN